LILHRPLAIALCFALATAGCSALLPRLLMFSAEQLAAKLAERMPFKRTFYGLLDLELDKPRVALDEKDGRVATLFDATLRTPLSTRAYSGAVKLSGAPRYEADSRSVMLGAARVELLNFDGVPGSLNRQLQDLATTLAQEVLDRRPLYTLKPEDLRFAGVQLNPSGVRIAGDRLVVDLAPR
jgi:hypothetical protein